jgi:hypothetical protein
MANPTATAAAQACGPVNRSMASPTRVATICPPTRARGCAGSASGDPMTSTIEVANGMTTSGKTRGDREPLHTANRRSCAKTRDNSRHNRPVLIAADGICRRLQPVQPHSDYHKQKGRQTALPPPRSLERMTYFRLVIAVRSAESLAMPAAPHQFEPVPSGLIAVTLVVPEALKAPVKALQLPFDRSVSE